MIYTTLSFMSPQFSSIILMLSKIFLFGLFLFLYTGYMHGFPYWEEWGESPHSEKFARSLPSLRKFSLQQAPHPTNCCSHPPPYPPKMSISYSLDTQVILILNLIDVQYLQKGVFSFEKGSNCQNHFSSGSLHPVKRSRPSKISDSHLTGKGEFPPCLTAIWKTLIYKTLWSLFVDGMQLPQGYTDPL